MSVAAVLVGSFVAMGYPRDVPAALPKDAIRVDVAAAPAGAPIPSGFIGFSIEYPSSLAYSGLDPAAPNPTFIRLVRGLTPNGSPVIRFGGDTTDWTWWPTKGVPKPPGVTYALTRRWLAVTRATALALRARLILGINLEADSPTIAGTEARALLRGLGPGLVAGFELGNEPEVYGTLGWYTNSAGVGVTGRSPRYDFASYVADYAAISSSLARSVPLVGPASGAPAWETQVQKFLASNPRVGVVTFHSYPLRRCYTPTSSSSYPTIPNLLSPKAASGPATSVQGAVAIAHAHGLRLRVDELNSVSCKGARGVSDTFASALWALDSLFHLAQVGVDGVNIHTFAGVPYEPFAFTHSGGRWQARVKPMYYGLLLFARAAPAGSRLVQTFHAPIAGLRTWATRGPGGTLRIVLMNESPTRPLTVAVGPPQPARAATLQRLLAGGLRATGGVTLAGQTFGAATASGELSGALRTVTLRALQHRYVVRLEPASAALLTLKMR